MRVRAVLLATALALAPLAAWAADLVVWWEEGTNPEEDTVVRETVAAFEDKTGKRVDLALVSQDDMSAKMLTALEVGRPPDFLFGLPISLHFERWHHEGRLADLTAAIDPFRDLFDADTLAISTRLDPTTGRRGLYSLPMAREGNFVHVWKSLLESAGLTLADIPKEWEAFWSFWCDKVQPAVRRTTGRDDIYGVGLSMSLTGETGVIFRQFVAAYGADYVTRDGRLVIDEPRVRDRLAKALDGYTAAYRKGCVPPDAVDWDSRGNNQAFLAQAVVMTVNNTLSVPNALRTARPEDYAKNAVTIDWPNEDAQGQPLTIVTAVDEAVVFKDGGHVATAEQFVRFLVGEGWLAHWLNFAGDRFLPPTPALLKQPFWLDPGDPHRMAAAMQFLTRPLTYDYTVASGEWRHVQVMAELVWPKAIRRVAADGLSPEQAADEMIARIKQILSE